MGWRRENTVPAERRLNPRYAVNGFVQVQNASGATPKECRLTNISDGGVRLLIETFEIADDFTLWLPGASGGRRRCRVVWRLGHEIGAEFVDRRHDDFAREVVRAGFGARRT